MPEPGREVCSGLTSPNCKINEIDNEINNKINGKINSKINGKIDNKINNKKHIKYIRSVALRGLPHRCRRRTFGMRLNKIEERGSKNKVIN
jgi:hypothetical protein